MKSCKKCHKGIAYKKLIKKKVLAIDCSRLGCITLTLRICSRGTSLLQHWPHLANNRPTGKSLEGEDRPLAMESLEEIILAYCLDTTVTSHLPCADFRYGLLCPEGQKWRRRGKKSLALPLVVEKPFRNPFLSLFLRLCNDIETNPGPPNQPRRRSKTRRDSR